MGTETTPTAPLERSVARAVLVTAWCGLALALIATALILATTTNGRMVTAELVPAEGRSPDLGADAAEAWAMYDTVRVFAPDPPLASRALRLAGYGLYGVLLIGGCVIAILLSRRILAGRPFARGAAPALAVLGALCIAAAVVAPAMLAEADYSAVTDLGLRLYDPAAASYLDTGSLAAEESLWPERFDRASVVLTGTNWPLAAVGGILTVIAIAFRRGLTLQRETDGLV